MNRREFEPGLEVTELEDSFDLDSLDFKKRLPILDGDLFPTTVAVLELVVVAELVEAAVRDVGMMRCMPRQSRYFSTVLIAASGSTLTGPPKIAVEC